MAINDHFQTVEKSYSACYGRGGDEEGVAN